MSKMFTLSLVGFVGLGLTVTGCGGESEPAFGATWALSLIGGQNQSITCDDAGTPTVVLDTMGPGGFTSHDMFPCSAGSGVSGRVPEGNFQVVLALVNGAGQEVSGVQDNFTVSRGGVNRLPPLTFDIQTFNVAWTLARGSTGVTCRDANAVTVRLITLLGNGKPVNYDFPCVDGNDSTTAVPIGTYSLQVQLLDPAGGVLSEVPAMTFPVTDTQPADLPPITFSVK
jgi:hypothetical protein